MQRHQRGRAGRVDGQRGAFEAEGVGDPAGGHAARAAGAPVAFELVGRLHVAAVVVVHHPGEDADVGAAQGGRIDAGPLEGLPGGLQQQPLLRVHRQRLTRRDPEEPGVELGHVVEESALADVGLTGPAGVRVVQLGKVPAAVLGEAGDRVHALVHQLPQLLGRTHPARQPAGHPDDRDRLLGVRRHHRLEADGGSGLVQQQLAQPAGDGAGGRVVEGQRGGQPQSGGLGQPVAQRDGMRRGEPEVLERAVGADRLDARQVGDLDGLGPDDVQQGAQLLTPGQPQQPPVQRLGDRVVGRAGDRRRVDQPVQQRGHLTAGRGRGVQLDRVEHGLIGHQGGVEHRQPRVGGQRADAGQGGTLLALTGRRLPGAPDQGEARQAPAVAVPGQRGDEVAVRALLALPVRAEQAGGRGEEHEARQVRVLGQLVQVDGAGDRLPQGVLRVHPAGQAGGVQHGGQRALVLGQHGRQRRPVGEVAGRQGHLGAERAEFGLQCGRRLVRGSLRADQQQLARAVAGDQVPGRRGTEHAVGAGDQHRVLGVEREGGRPV